MNGRRVTGEKLERGYSEIGLECFFGVVLINGTNPGNACGALCLVQNIVC